jgi:hypothetical protein
MKKITTLTIALIFLGSFSSNAQMVAAKVATDVTKENKKELVVKEKNKKASKGFNFNKSNKYLKKQSCSSSAQKSCCSKEKDIVSSSSKKTNCNSENKKKEVCSSTEKKR